MVKIPERNDPTLEAADRALEASQKPYISKNIGFGEIGEECSRKLWYKINTDEAERFEAKTLRIFERGHQVEEDVARYLRRVPGIELYTHDPDRDNKQYKMDALDGRFTGRLDGVIVGLVQAPKTPHVWEHKEVNEKKFNELKKLIDKLGEKNALREWNFVYYCQAQSNMYHIELDRHYMTVSTPGFREILALRTELDKDFALSLVKKADRIIRSKEPPERIGGPDYFGCKFCRFYEKCHSK
jgi:hypothetical protein